MLIVKCSTNFIGKVAETKAEEMQSWWLGAINRLTWLQASLSDCKWVRLTNVRFDEAVGAIAASVEDVDGTGLGIEEDEEIIVAE